MTRHTLFKISAVLLCIISLASRAEAEIIRDNDFGFALDIPEGFALTDATDDGTSVLLTHQNIPVTLAIKIYCDQKYESSFQAMDTALSKLSAKSATDGVDWSGEKCAISTFELSLDQRYKGWAVCAPIKHESYLVVLCYSPEEIFQQCQYFIVSAVNSLSIKDELYSTPGIFMDYAFPKSGKKNFSVRIAGKEIKSSMDLSDAEAADCLVNIEYSVLTMYANHPKMMEAWERYYRLIYRDSFGRLAGFSSDVHDALYARQGAQHSDDADINYAQSLLSWVQGFNYKRADSPTASDFTSLPDVLLGVGNDCDSRSMLLCVLLKSAGIDSIFLFSPAFSHAMAGAALNAPGQTFLLSANNRPYLMGETTASVTWGTIAQEHADRSKWFPVILP